MKREMWEKDLFDLILYVTNTYVSVYTIRGSWSADCERIQYLCSKEEGVPNLYVCV